MNNITLKGVLSDCKYSHTLNGVDYEKANLIVKRKDGKEDVITICFKKFSNNYNDGQMIDLVGNVRSYTRQLDNGKNKVNIYVFTYFDLPTIKDDTEIINEFEIDGRICKIDEIRKTSSGKENIHFILANNLIIEESNKKLNSYLPCIAWGNVAKELEKCNVNDKLFIKGELHSREYKKQIGEGEIEIRVAHELVVNSYEIVK